MRLIILCAAALVGLALGDLGRLGEPLRLLFGALIAALGTCLAWRHSTWRWLALATCALAAGGLRASMVATTPPAELEAHAGQVIRLGGRLVEPPTLSSSGAALRLVLQVDAAGPAGHDPPPAPPARLTVLADPALLEPPTIPDDPATRPSPVQAIDFVTLGSQGVADDTAPRRSPAVAEDSARLGLEGGGGSPPGLAGVEVGDYLVLEGRLLGADGGAPPTLFFPRVLQHVRSLEPSPWAWLANLRSKSAAGIGRYLPEPQASLSAGLLLGGSGQLDAEFRVQLQRSGLAHLVAIDGYKQVVVAAALGALSVRLLGARLATLPIILGIAGYTLLTGAHPSAVRAALMVGLASVAAVTGRVADPLTSLLVAVLVMAALDPSILLDVGLQLSLSATLGIVLLWPRLRRRLRGIPSFIAEPAGLTLAVTLATLPVASSVFQSVSLISPVAHIVAVPLLPLALASTALLATVSSVAPLANMVAWLAWLPTTLLVEVIRVCGSLPGAALSTGRLPIQAALGLAAGLLAWGLWGLPEAAGVRQRWARLRLAERRWSVPAASLCAGLAAVGLLQLVRPDGRPHVHTLSAGRGQAVFIRGPTGHAALVVGGRVGAAMLAGQVADHLAVWEHKLDTVLQLDAAAGAGLGLTLARYPADQRFTAAHDERIDLGGGATLHVYATTEDQRAPRVALSFGQIWWPLFGHPPPPSAETPPSSGQPRPLLQPDQEQQIEHDHEKYDDQLDPFADNHRDSPNVLCST